MERPKLICLTPVLNEGWILERFLKCASLWADHIVIADQQSTDGSREIARSFPKVTLIDNVSATFNEPERQQMLLAEARRIPGPKVLLALDADEFLTANFLASREWETILHAPPGTVIFFQWPLVHTNISGLCYYMFPKELPIGFVDDGTPHRGKIIHSFRVPTPSGARTLYPNEIKLMHYCLIDPDRFAGRIRWYQCWEHLKLHRRPIELYRFYHQPLYVPSSVVKPVPQEWMLGYEQEGIDMTSVNREGTYRWDREVLQLFNEHGTARFKRLAVWNTDWDKLHDELYPEKPKTLYPDPRSRFDKVIQRWLRRTEPAFGYHATPGYGRRLYLRLVEKALGLFGW
jgi:hypothetical protein